jgi:hypothetical protein
MNLTRATGPPTSAWSNKDWQVGNKNAPVKNGHVATLQSTNAPDKKSHFGGARNMALAIGNIKWWRGKSKNVFSG